MAFVTVPPRTHLRRYHSACVACAASANGAAAQVVRGVSRRQLLSRILAVGVATTCAQEAAAIERADAPPRLYDDAAEIGSENGLKYFDLSIGTGTQVGEGNTVLVHYTSRLAGLNGIRLDATRDGQGGGEPYRYTVGDNDGVPGFDQALRGMRVGGKRRVLCPPSLAYANPLQKPAVNDFFARRRLLSVINTSRDATVVFEYVSR